MVKEFKKEEQFVTRWHHRRPRYWFRKDRPRVEGYRTEPDLIRFDPEQGVEPSSKPPVRIFLGTEPAQARAERVFIWSVKRARDPSRAYEIYLMKDLQGFDRHGWKTGFTNYRYAIPALARGKGRAIYNDVDQIYLADPAELFDMDMGEAGMLGITGRETSVMLLDCGKMIPHWTFDDAAKGKKHGHFRDIVHERKLWGQMPGEWNARDEEFRAGQSKCFHFTTLQTQPWQPFTDQLRYDPHPDGDIWFNLERSADSVRFTPFTRQKPSGLYAERAARRSRSNLGKPSGFATPTVAAEIAAMVAATGSKSLLVYSAGQSSATSLSTLSVVSVASADPFAPPSHAKYDGVVSEGGLELFPEDDVAWLLDEMFGAANKFVIAFVSCDPAQEANLTVQTPPWWRGQFELAHKRNPNIRWVLATEQKTKFSKKRQIHSGDGAAEKAA